MDKQTKEKTSFSDLAMQINSSPYVLITAAYNEESYIQKTLESVVAQTVKPQKWIIVSDGSTDKTEKIVSNYVDQSQFVQLIRLNRNGCNNRRNFASKVDAINFGYRYLQNIEYDFIGNLDADISFGPDYYKEILRRFLKNPDLGIAGGIVYDFYKSKIHKRRHYLISVSGSVQFFRRSCYECIGGYIPQKYGGVDTIAEITARMLGWKTRTFPEIEVLHYRRAGTEGMNVLTARFLEGRRDYMLGSHPVFYFTRCLYGTTEPPYFLGGMIRFLGFFLSYLNRKKATLKVSKEFIEYIRNEQKKKLRGLFNLS